MLAMTLVVPESFPRTRDLPRDLGRDLVTRGRPQRRLD